MPPGSTICLRPGTYEVTLIVRQSLILRGAGRPEQVVLRAGGEPDSAILDVYPQYRETVLVLLENLTIEGAFGGEGYGEERSDHGLFIDRNAHVLLRNVICSDNGGAAVYVEEEGSLVAYECTFGDSMYGVLLAGHCGARLSDCTISGNEMGVGLAEGGQLDLSECAISGNTEFGALLVGGQATLDRCEITGNAWGIVIGAPGRTPAQLHMTSCTVNRNEHVGIALLSPDCYDPEAPAGASALVSGEWNEIPGPSDPEGNTGGALCPAPPHTLWPEGFLRD